MGRLVKVAGQSTTKTVLSLCCCATSSVMLTLFSKLKKYHSVENSNIGRVKYIVIIEFISIISFSRFKIRSLYRPIITFVLSVLPCYMMSIESSKRRKHIIIACNNNNYNWKGGGAVRAWTVTWRERDWFPINCWLLG